MNEAQQPQEECEDQQPVPLTQALGYGAGTFLAAGMVDVLAHLGPTGLVVGGIVAYAASRHGPELVEQVREAFPSSPAPQMSRRAGQARNSAEQHASSKRSFLDRALGRFPAPDERSLEDVDAILVDELVEETALEPSSRQTKRRPVTKPIAHPLMLAPDLVLEANDIVGAGINIFGIKGSGKTVTAIRLAEQFARWRVSLVFFDIKGDALTMVTDHRPDGRPYVPNGLVGVRGRAPRGRSTLNCQLQTVYDLRTWQTPEQAANLICVIVEELLETVATTSEEIAPCLVFLDEAEYWLPQSRPSYLSQHTYNRLLDAFHTLATMGRSRGLAPVMVTQRIAKVNKDIIAQAEMTVLMKAMLDIDLDRYHEYFNKSLVSDERIRGFEAGDAVVCLPDGRQVVTRFSERESRHLSHTPHITAALAKFERRQRGPLEVELNDVTGVAAYVPSADQSIGRVTTPPQAGPHGMVEERRSTPAARTARAHLSPELEQALRAWNEGATSVDKLEKALGITHHHAYKLYRQLRDLRLI